MAVSKKSIFFLMLFFLLANMGFAQKVKKYFVFLKDKANSQYSIKKPDEFLSKAALDRRKLQDIQISEKDLPVNQNYIDLIKNTGAEFWYASKWMNGVMVLATDSAIGALKSLPCVKSVLTLTEYTNVKKKKDAYVLPAPGTKTEIIIENSKDYGNAYNQVQQIGADEMHRQGFKGKGMVIAVFDAGFLNADKLNTFTHLFNNGRVLGTYNFVDYNTNVFGTGDHGTKVLSTIAAYDKGKMIGTAPEASFYLFRTEDASSEYRVEEVNWLIAAERADSLGVDVINSSLGYTTFDDRSMNYSYKDMNGRTALITQAADLAAATGMLVVTSAGNEGGDTWQYVSAPADADSVFTIGAVDADGMYAYFSSTGYTSDRRLKPNVSAQGLGTVVTSPAGNVTTSSGTSFSSPLMCGLVAGFWQANPKLKNMQVMDYLQQSGSQSIKPDSLLGYGIPSFKRAQELVLNKRKSRTGFLLYPNPLDTQETLKVYLNEEYQGKDVQISLYDSYGVLITNQVYKKVNSEEYDVSGTATLQSGIYLLKIAASESLGVARLIKL